MKNLHLFLLLILISILISGIYGIIHDQITFSISEEYFTKFKFYQFNLDPLIQNRFGVGIIGFLSTWWVGFFVGTILTLVGLIHKNVKRIFELTLKSFFITILITVLTPIVVIAIWSINTFYCNQFNYNLYHIDLPVFVPQGVIIKDVIRFYIVGLIHNSSYVGGFFGLVVSIIYHFLKYWKFKKMQSSL